MPDTESAVTNWLAQQLRLTVFPTPDAGIGSPDWWQELNGEPPDLRVESPKHASKKVEGRAGDGSLVLEIQPFRIDWRWESVVVVEDGIVPSEMPVIGPLDSALATFSGLMSRWLAMESVPKVQRVALGSVLTLRVDSRESGYDQILRLVPALKIDPQGSTDLLYQINHPRPSRSNVPGLAVNRLTKWSVAAFQQLAVAGGAVATTAKQYSCRLELDINTDGEHKDAFTRDQLPQLFSELVDLAMEIAQRGDVA